MEHLVNTEDSEKRHQTEVPNVVDGADIDTDNNAVEALSIVEKEPNEEPSGEVKLRAYRIVCAKLGLSMCVYFAFRLLVGLISAPLFRATSNLSGDMQYVIHSFMIIIMVYVIPLLVTALIFKSFKNYKGKYRLLYKKPKRLARALGTFPATFGFGHGTALLTLLVSYLLSRFLGGETLIEDLIRPPAMEPSTEILPVLMMVFMMVIIAPLFEEIWTRGIMFDALKPYGTGMAIIISSVIFGLMHGSLYTLFYTTAYGFALGYIRYATDSLLIVTILHALVNGIAAGVLLLGSLAEMAMNQNRLLNTALNFYMLAAVIFIIIGVVVFISKIPAIRKFTIENSWADIGPLKKIGFFLVSVPVIVMLVLAFNEHAGGWLSGLLLN